MPGHTGSMVANGLSGASRPVLFVLHYRNVTGQSMGERLYVASRSVAQFVALLLCDCPLADSASYLTTYSSYTVDDTAECYLSLSFEKSTKFFTTRV